MDEQVVIIKYTLIFYNQKNIFITIVMNQNVFVLNL